MKRMHLRTVLVAAFTFGIVVDAASAWYNPRTGRFLSRNPISEPGAMMIRQVSPPVSSFIARDSLQQTVGLIRIGSPVSTSGQFLTLSIEPADAMLSQNIISSVAREPNPSEDADVEEAIIDEINLYNYARSSPLVYIDSLGLSTKCGPLTMKCKKGPVQWPVYGNSGRAKHIFSKGGGCVTLLFPKGIYCSGSCSQIKEWNSSGDPTVKILEHEACHACAHEDPCDSYFLSWIPGDLTGHCNRHKRSATPGW